MKHLPRTQERVTVDQRDRLRQVERKAGKDDRLKSHEISPASQYDTVTVTDLAKTPAWDVWTGGQIVALIVRLATTGSSNTVVTFYLNGNSIGTVTLGSGVSRNVGTVDVRCKSADGIQVVVTTAGTSAKGLSAFVRMRG